MKYRRVGKSGVTVSEIGLGSWLTEDKSNYVELIKRAYDLGINHFDSANIYGATPHESEEVLGQVLSQFPRNGYVVTTKAWGPVGSGPNDRGLGRKHLLSEVDKSLRAFNTDYIDIFYCHRFDTETDLEETLRTLDDLITQGKVLYIGFSEWTPTQISSAIQLQKELGFRKFSVSQPQYNLLDRDMEQHVLRLCDVEGIGQVVFSALAQGILSGKYIQGIGVPPGSRVDTYGRLFPLGLASPDRNRQSRKIANEYRSEPYSTIVERLSTISNEAGMTLSQLALAWALRLPQVSSALIGASKIEQLNENVQATEIHLSDHMLSQIAKIFTDGY